MPTTSGHSAARALAGLAESRCEFALLTPVASIPAGPSSDIDLVVAVSPALVVANSHHSWAAVGLHPIMFWPYDASGSAAVFLVSTDASDGVQLDMLYDPTARHGYRVSSTGLLARRREVDGLPHVDEIGLMTYLWQKRRSKGQQERVAQILDRVRLLPEGEVRGAEEAITGQTTLARSAFEGEVIPEFDRRRTMADLLRYAQRLSRPPGFWVHCDTPTLAKGLRDRLSRVVVSTHSGAIPDQRWRIPAWYATVVWPQIVRPRAYFSWGGRLESRRRSLVEVTGSLDSAAEIVVARLAERVVQCVS